MKTTRYITALMLAVATLVAAIQTKAANTLTIPDVTTKSGQTWLPVIVDNTDKIVAIQFDLTLPEGVEIPPPYSDSSTFELSERTEGMTATVTKVRDHQYRVLLYHPDNHPIIGNNGEVMRISVDVSYILPDGATYPLTVDDAVLSTVTGENVITACQVGSVKIPTGPDLIVKDLIYTVDDLSPGEEIDMEWKVENIGDEPTGAGWRESISLMAEDGTTLQLLSRDCNKILGVGSEEKREAEIRLPEVPGIDGPVKIMVSLSPMNNMGESSQHINNNTLLSETFINVQKKLTLTISPQKVNEGSSTKVSIKLLRSGRRDTSQDFSLTATQDSRVEIPNHISIKQGKSEASLSLTVKGNEVADADSVISLSVEGNGYPTVEGSFKIVDNIRPLLSLSVPQKDVYEGRTFTLLLTRNFTDQNVLEVEIACENRNHFDFPSKVMMQPEEFEKIITVTVIDDDEIEEDKAVAFRATTSLYESGECLVMFHDNDLPTLTMTITPDAIGEAQGMATPATGIIRCVEELNTDIELWLSDDSQGELSLALKKIKMKKGEKEVMFPIAIAKDNDNNEGDRKWKIFAEVFSSSCNCTMSSSKAHISTTITVIDDDGPSLCITSPGTAVLEGSKENVFTIRANNKPSHDLLLNISSDHDNILVYDHQLTMPKGVDEVTFMMDVESNNETADDAVATLKVAAEGYAMGTCPILITDQNLPDATIRLSAAKTEAEAEDALPLTLSIRNNGNAILRKGTPIAIQLLRNGSKVKEAMAELDRSVVNSDSALVEYNYAVPSLVGYYEVRAVINPKQKVRELLYTNNNSNVIGLAITSPFNLTAMADKKTYRSGEDVVITGKALGERGRNADIKICLINNLGEIECELMTTTDNEGHYSVTWRPLVKQVGHYSVGACHRSEKTKEEMDAFDIIGLRWSVDNPHYDLIVSQTNKVSIQLSNPMGFSQTGLTMVCKQQPDNCDVVFHYPQQIDANGNITMELTMTGTAATEGRYDQSFYVTVTTAEGAQTDIGPLYYYVKPQKAQLWTQNSFIKTTMVMGKAREYPITISNRGSAPTGNISVSCPQWMSPRNVASIDPGDSATVVMRFTQDESMKINQPQQGYFSFNPANGDAWRITFDITPVTREKGTLTLDVVDEFSFYGTDNQAQAGLAMVRTAADAETPHVSDARVKVMKPGTYEVVAEGTTDYNGIFTAELPGGFYNVSVEAEGHKRTVMTKEVPPGTDTTEEVMLWLDNYLDYSWTVKETEIEDEYQGELTLIFDSRVPAPQIHITLPDSRPQVGAIFPVSVTNKGFINTRNVRLSVSASKGYGIEYLSETGKDVLGPNQSYVAYVRLTKDNWQAANIKGDGNNKDADDCLGLNADTESDVDCERFSQGLEFHAEKKYGNGDCASFPSKNASSKSNKHDMDEPREHDSGGGTGGYFSGTPEPVSATARDCNNSHNTGGHGGSSDYHPEEYECPISIVDCPDPTYKIVRSDGNPNVEEDIRVGVAADGVSKVNILSDVIVKGGDCVCDEHMWSLIPNLGTLKGDKWNATYIAPDSLPSDTKESITVFAMHTWKTGEGCVCSQTDVIPIVIRRPPLVLLHGLNSDETCWKKLKRRLVKEHLYEEDQICNSGYPKTHNSHFKENVGKVSEMINELINTYKTMYQLEAQKVDIVGHSMGGIVARLHAQYHSSYDVHKIITVNTPHSGSQMGDFVMWHPALWPLAKALGFRPLDAVSDLATESSAIDSYLNNSEVLERLSGIRTHAIVTKFKPGLKNLESIALLSAEFIAICNKIDPWGTLLALSVGTAGAIYVKNSIEGADLKDFDWIWDSDLVVSLESQKGGLIGENITYIEGPDHVASPQDDKVLEAIIRALNESASGSMFAKGFHPKNITYTKLSAPKRKVKNLRVANSGNLQVQAWREGNMLHAKAGEVGDMNQMIIAVFDDQHSHVSLGDTLMCEIPSTFSGNVVIQGLRLDADENAVMDSTSVNIPQARVHPISVSYEGSSLFTIGFDRDISLTCLWEDGSETAVTPDHAISSNRNVRWDDGVVRAVKVGDDVLTFYFNGLTCSAPIKVLNYVQYNDNQQGEDSPVTGNGDDGNGNEDGGDDNSNSVCSSITLKFSQNMVMTRQAFRGTLTLRNKLDNTPMRDIKLILEVTDAEGKVATSREIQTEVESLSELEGEKNLNAGWTLRGGKEGTATILFIPTQYAASTEPITYTFGGALSYSDPYTGKTVVRRFSPVELKVNPSPLLDLTYFIQRDVIGDNPLTETVEPMVAAEFALLISNVGYGDAKNVRLTTGQPVIVENEKGLAIDFDIVSSQLNGNEKCLALGESVVTNFGEIKAHMQACAQWWLQSTLLGHFTDYDVRWTHVTSHDNPDLSLIRNTTIHELIHGFSCDTQDGVAMRGFLVNDLPDSKHTPDHVFFTDATDEKVSMVQDMQCVKIGDLRYRLTVKPSSEGWNYGVIADPTEGRYVLSSMIRESDGIPMQTDNVWQTNITLRDNKDPLYENRLHFVGLLNRGEENYIVAFEKLPEQMLEVERITGVPEEGALVREPVRQVVVVFNKDIDPSTFSTEDISLSFQGQQMLTDVITISRMSDRQFALDLSSITMAEGYYILTIQTGGIVDKQGYRGRTGKTVSWVHYADGKVSVSIKTEPEVGGTVTPVSGKFGYGSVIHLEATSAYGYQFSHWIKEGQKFGNEQSCDFFVSENAEIYAVFIPLTYPVEIDYDDQQGTVANTPSNTYQYDYGTVIHLTAIPNEKYRFIGWMVNEQLSDSSESCDISVCGPMIIKPMFEYVSDGIDPVIQHHGIRFWPVPAGDHLFISGYFREIRQVRVYDILGKASFVSNNIGEDGMLDLKALPPGLYIISATTDKGIYYGKVIKQ